MALPTINDLYSSWSDLESHAHITDQAQIDAAENKILQDHPFLAPGMDAAQARAAGLGNGATNNGDGGSTGFSWSDWGNVPGATYSIDGYQGLWTAVPGDHGAFNQYLGGNADAGGAINARLEQNGTNGVSAFMRNDSTPGWEKAVDTVMPYATAAIIGFAGGAAIGGAAAGGGDAAAAGTASGSTDLSLAAGDTVGTGAGASGSTALSSAISKGISTGITNFSNNGWGVGTNNGGSGMDNSGLGNVLQGGAGLVGGYLSAQEAQQFGQQLAQIANPFGQYNAQFAQQLASQGAMPNYAQQYLGTAQSGSSNALDQQMVSLAQQGPAGIVNDPAYQAAFGQGLQANQRTLAAQGLNLSGNQLTALQDYGMGKAQSFYDDRLNSLMGAQKQQYGEETGNLGLASAANQQYFSQMAQLSGLSNGSPGAAAQAMSNVYKNVGSAYDSMGQGVGQILNGLGYGSSSAAMGGLGSALSSGWNNVFGADTTNAAASNASSAIDWNAVYGTASDVNTDYAVAAMASGFF